MEHGTESAYVHGECRCEFCRAAASEARRARRRGSGRRSDKPPIRDSAEWVWLQVFDFLGRDFALTTPEEREEAERC